MPLSHQHQVYILIVRYLSNSMTGKLKLYYQKGLLSTLEQLTVFTAAKSYHLYFGLTFLDKTKGWRMLPEDFYLYKDNS